MTDVTARVLADYCKSDFSISTVDLTFELVDDATIVTNVMAFTRENAEARSLILNGEQLLLVSLLLDGEPVLENDYQISSNALTLSTTKSVFELTVITKINPIENTSLEGLFKSGGAFCTQCEAEGFRRMSYYLDRPDVMAKFSTKVIADKEKYPFLLSNGNKVDEGDLPNGLHFVTWVDPFVKPSYLFALVAGDFDLLSDSYITGSGKEVMLEIFVDKGNLNKAHHAMNALKKSMAWDEDVFGLEYDLDIYMIVAVDFFNMGAMENKGLNVFNSKYVLADESCATDVDYFNIEAVIAHEYFHNWTGNRVTCRDWFQLSLKEGLTVFRDQQFSGDMHSSAVTRVQNVRVLRSQQFPEDAGPMAHPIRPEKVVEMNNFYTLTVYEKGSEVIRMLHTLLGADKFRKGMDLYFKRFDGMAVTCDDFVDAMADASEINLSQFKNWYSQSGTPELSVSESFDKKTKTFSLTMTQYNRPSQVQKVKQDLHIPIQIELLTQEKKVQKLLQLKNNKQTWHFSDHNVKPTVAFLSNFSAPVKVTYEQTEDELEYITMHATDAFNRWDAGQQLLTRYILALVNDVQFSIPRRLLTLIENVLTQGTDLALKAEQLTLPSFDELTDKIPQVDPINLLNAIQKIKLFIAKNSESLLLKAYQGLTNKTYENNAEAIAERAFKNACLSYLSELPSQQALISAQYKHSDNMTDTLAALSCLAKVSFENSTKSVFKSFMNDFESKWQKTTLVMDKWFSIQASLNDDSIFEQLTSMEQHPLFSLKNPNRARSLIGAFIQNNPRYFHCANGDGYRFLTKQLIELDAINPQVASRLVTPLIQFSRFDLQRQAMMKSQLLALKALPKLSKDLQEKIDAALI